MSGRPGRKDVCRPARVAPAFSLPGTFNQPSHRSIVPRRPSSSQIRKEATSRGQLVALARPLLFSRPSPPLVCISFPHSAYPTMSPYNDQQPHTVIKSESPPLQSVPISSIGQPYSTYSDNPLFRFGTKEHSAPLPPFSFLSRPRSSSFSPHSPMSHLNTYSSAVSGSQSHFAVPPVDDPDVLTPTDEYDDDEGGDFPSASGSSSKIDKSVRRRSSKGASRFSASLPFDCTDYGPQI